MRTFIHYDEAGEVVAVVQTESLPEGVRHPFYIEDERHGVLEVTGDEKAGWQDGGDIGRAFKVDVAKRRLVVKSAPKRVTGGAIKRETTTEAPAAAASAEAPAEASAAAAAEASAEESAAASQTKAVTTRSATKTSTKKPATKKSGANKSGTKKSGTEKAATKKGKRSSGSK